MTKIRSQLLNERNSIANQVYREYINVNEQSVNTNHHISKYTSLCMALNDIVEDGNVIWGWSRYLTIVLYHRNNLVYTKLIDEEITVAYIEKVLCKI